jgi:hypothetical protein
MLREEVIKSWNKYKQKLKKEREFIEFLTEKFNKYFNVFASNQAKVEDELEN